MQFCRAHSAVLIGLNAAPVTVEVDTSQAEKPILVIVGLPDTAVRESKDRVLAAIKNCGEPMSTVYATVNLAPGDVRKEGALYDLPIALGLLKSLGKIKGSLEDFLIVGEMGLSGEVRAIKGALPIALLARLEKKKGLILPFANGKEAAVVTEIPIYPVRTLKEAISVLNSSDTISSFKTSEPEEIFKPTLPKVDFSEIKGQKHVKRALEIAAAGGHNVLLSGPPGSGKTMLAKATLGIMPELNLEEALEITRIHSVRGLLSEGQSLVTSRPFRSPHHTISYAGLIGGGAIPIPGELSLAHRGILFLDELPEFSRNVLESLRQPLEDRVVTISRAQGSFIFPTDVMCICAMNPCPCGLLGHPDKPCRDTPMQIHRYRGKISAPLWDRLDLHIEVPALRYKELILNEENETSEVVRKRVKKAREVQYTRQGAGIYNALLAGESLKIFGKLDKDCQQVIQQSVDVLGISTRAVYRLIRVARTIADLEESKELHSAHLLEALSLRERQVEVPAYTPNYA